MSIWQKMTAIPREVIMALVLVAIIVPAMNPLGLPLMVGSMSEAWYDTIDSLPADSVILFDIGYGSGGYPSLGPGNIAAFHQMFEKDLKIVIMATSLEGTLMYPLIMDSVLPEQNYGAVYGEDYVFIGYIAGGQTAMAGVLGDLQSLVTNDYQGNAISTFSLMDNVGGADDFALVAYVTTAGETAEGWVYQASSQYNVVVLGGCLSMMTTSIKPYYDSGQIAGIMDGIKGAADLEFLTGHAGDAIVSSDILTFTQSLVLIFIIVGNVSWYMTKKEAS